MQTYTKQILAALAISGAVATFAFVNVNTASTGSNFLQMTQMEEHEHEFIQFLAKYRKTYGTKEEYNYRLSVFAEKYYFAKEENASQDSYTLGMNKFADMNDYEFKQFLGYKPAKQTNTPVCDNSGVTTVDSIDWTTKGAVTGVKNQGSCGSCWTFSTTGSLEGFYYLSGNELTSFSEQQIVDCDFITIYDGGELGCDGGDMYQAHTYTAAKGISAEADYPYTGKRGTCDESKATYKPNTGACYV